MRYQTLNFKITRDIGYIKLNRPERMSSFDLKLGEELYEVLKNFSKNNKIKAIVIRGTLVYPLRHTFL
jgi:enoyl-CoA hydratase/carnithine racemase